MLRLHPFQRRLVQFTRPPLLIQSIFDPSHRSARHGMYGHGVSAKTTMPRHLEAVEIDMEQQDKPMRWPADFPGKHDKQEKDDD